jgi:hypothetical protein
LIEYIKKTGYPHTVVAVQWDIKAVHLTNILKKRAGEVRCGNSWGNEWVYKVLNGSQDFGFWKSRKQRVLIAD